MKQFNLSNLPKYWAVRLDKEHPFSKEFINILNFIGNSNESKSTNWIGSSYGGYYGYDGNSFYGGTASFYNLLDFKNAREIKELTMDEFQQLVTNFSNINNNYSIF